MNQLEVIVREIVSPLPTNKPTDQLTLGEQNALPFEEAKNPTVIERFRVCVPTDTFTIGEAVKSFSDLINRTPEPEKKPRAPRSDKGVKKGPKNLEVKPSGV